MAIAKEILLQNRNSFLCSLKIIFKSYVNVPKQMSMNETSLKQINPGMKWQLTTFQKCKLFLFNVNKTSEKVELALREGNFMEIYISKELQDLTIKHQIRIADPKWLGAGHTACLGRLSTGMKLFLHRRWETLFCSELYLGLFTACSAKWSLSCILRCWPRYCLVLEEGGFCTAFCVNKTS